MNTVKDRLLVFLEYKKMSKNQFEKKINAGAGWASKINDKISEDKLNDISKNFPNLNLDWLQFGEGNMLLEQIPTYNNVINISKQQGNGNLNTVGNVTNNNDVSDNEIIKNLSETVKSQQETISNLLKKLLQ